MFGGGMSIVRVAAALGFFLRNAVVARRLEVKSLALANKSLSAGFPNKCTITWPLPGGDGTVEFGVPSCTVSCKVTNADYRHTRMFASLFKPMDNGRFCSCLDGKRRQLVKFPGGCGDDAEQAKLKCYERYKVVKTNSFVKEAGKKTSTTKPNAHLWADSVMDYKCDTNACTGGECTTGHLPSVTHGRDDQETEIIRDVLKKNRRGQELTKDEQQLVEIIPDEDADAVLFGEYSPDGSPITVGTLRADLEKQLKGENIDVSYFLTAVDFLADQQAVDLPAFRRYSKALRETRKKGEVSPEDIAEIFYDELSPDGTAILAPSFKDQYEARITNSGRSVAVALREAGIPEDHKVDLQAYKRFKNALPGAFETDELAGELLSGKGKATVKSLRKVLAARVLDEGVDVGHVLTTLGLTSETDEVDVTMTKRVVKLLRKAFRDTVSGEDVDEILFGELSPAGAPVTVQQLKAVYSKEMEDTGVDVGFIMTRAGITSESAEVDLEIFKTFRKTLRKVRSGELVPTTTTTTTKGAPEPLPTVGEVDGEELFKVLSADSQKTTVAKLRALLKDMLKGEGVDIGHVLQLSELPGENQAVDLVLVKRVAKILKKARHGGATEGDVEEALFEELSGGASTVKASQIKDAYEDEVMSLVQGYDVGHIMSVAGIADDEQEVDLNGFKAFRKKLIKARNGELPAPPAKRKPTGRSSFPEQLSTVCPRTRIIVEHEGGTQLSYTLGRTDQSETIKVFCADSDPPAPGVTDGSVTFGCREDRRWDVIAHTCVGTGNPIFTSPAILEQDEGQELLMLGVHHRCCCDSEDKCLWYHQDFLTEPGILQEAGKCPRVKKKNGKTCTLDRWCMSSRSCWGSSSRTHHDEDRCEIVTRAAHPEAFFDGHICQNGSAE